MSILRRVEIIDPPYGSVSDLYLTASSFEPRSVRASSLLADGSFRHAVIFNYEDTLDSVIGRYNSREIRRHLTNKMRIDVNILPCQFKDPYSVVRVFSAFLDREPWAESVDTVTIDVTCFTKIHLLLLFQYLDEIVGISKVRVCYTEPLSYATAFGRALSYGIDKTVYLPYQTEPHDSLGLGLIAFLGHERIRLERIVQELEPDISVVLFGEPGFAQNMQDYSRRVNRSLIERTTYDQQYRLSTASTKDPIAVADVLHKEVERIQSDGCDSVYLAPLGTKLQALGIDLLRRLNLPIRLLLAYSIPQRYERNMYSQGSGATYLINLYE